MHLALFIMDYEINDEVFMGLNWGFNGYLLNSGKIELDWQAKECNLISSFDIDLINKAT